MKFFRKREEASEVTVPDPFTKEEVWRSIEEARSILWVKVTPFSPLFECLLRGAMYVSDEKCILAPYERPLTELADPAKFKELDVEDALWVFEKLLGSNVAGLRRLGIESLAEAILYLRKIISRADNEVDEYGHSVKESRSLRDKAEDNLQIISTLGDLFISGFISEFDRQNSVPYAKAVLFSQSSLLREAVLRLFREFLTHRSGVSINFILSCSNILLRYCAIVFGDKEIKELEDILSGREVALRQLGILRRIWQSNKGRRKHKLATTDREAFFYTFKRYNR